MIKLTPAAGRVIADDSVAMFNSSDEALLHSARLTVSVLEGTAKSGMHPRTKQKLLESMNAGHEKLLQSRREFTNAHRQMLAIQRNSTIQPYNWGCWAWASHNADIDDSTALDVADTSRAEIMASN